MSKDFKRQDSHKKKGTPDSWRKPTGKHSDVRLGKKSAGATPGAGHRTDKDSRGVHPSGYTEVLVHRPEDLEDLEESEAARIAAKVGGRKREQIVEKAEELDVKLLNAGGNE